MLEGLNLIQRPAPAIVSAMHALLMPGKQLFIKSFAEVSKFSNNDLQFFMLQNGLYSIPTIELINFLQDNFMSADKNKALEIAAGNGALARGLGIRATDSYLQNDPQIKAYYKKAGQPPVIYSAEVEQLEATEAVKRYKPSVVFGSYVTHKWNGKNGNIFGVDHLSIMKLVEWYILIGNDHTHSENPLFNTGFYCQTIRLPYLICRAKIPALNGIYVFQNYTL